MIRDFSNSAKKKLLEYVKDATETTLWRKIGDRIGDAGLQIQYWFGALSISKYIDNLDAYHKKIIDKNNTTSQRIEEIFTNVKNIDTRYQGGLQQNVNFSETEKFIHMMKLVMLSLLQIAMEIVRIIFIQRRMSY